VAGIQDRIRSNVSLKEKQDFEVDFTVTVHAKRRQTVVERACNGLCARDHEARKLRFQSMSIVGPKMYGKGFCVNFIHFKSHQSSFRFQMT
jgi:hypothetical protein